MQREKRIARPAEGRFRRELRESFAEFAARQARRFAPDSVIRIDLHCHDANSDVPDELLGRILRCPETWTTTDDMREALAAAGTEALTITNHNNARSCFELQDRGVDVLVGAEYTCHEPQFGVSMHVLAYGFSPHEAEELNLRRRDIHGFVEYAGDHDIPTVLAHPLYFYAPSRVPTLALVEKLTMMFDAFEVINGQRDAWQNMLVAAWIEGLTEERVRDISRRTGIAPDRYCRRPYRKSMTGGSDCHTGLFAGATGTLIHVPDLARRRASEPASDLVLEGLRRGESAPFGSYCGEEKMTAAFIDFFCQASLRLEDPGLIRTLLHKGEPQDKLVAAVVANAIFELRRHRYTSRFLKTTHEAMHGKRPGLAMRRMTKRDYRPLVRELELVALAGSRGPAQRQRQIEESIPALFRGLVDVIAARAADKAKDIDRPELLGADVALGTMRGLELPLDLRALIDSGRVHGRHGANAKSLSEWTDRLSFPVLAAAVLQGSAFASSKVLYGNRSLLDDFSKSIGRHEHPRKALWLTDTFFDRNGVANALQLVHEEVCRRDLPVDFAVVHGDAAPREHLHVLAPVTEFTLSLYEDQPVRVFDPMEMQRIFAAGGYDRVVCSTELLAGLAGLFLKHAFSIPAYFYLHTDWIDFARRTLRFDDQATDRLRRILRAFYGSFDGLFVLNTEQRDWLVSDAMGIDPRRVFPTAHWIDREFAPRPVRRELVFPGIAGDEPVMLYAGRVSEEKGVLELPEILAGVRKTLPETRLAVAGVGPALDRLRAAAPEAITLGWLTKAELADAYTAADALVLPSRFDTFGNVVLEALGCGLPVVAYDTKGPRDIVVHGECGFLASTPDDFVVNTKRLLENTTLRWAMRLAARERATAYNPDAILGKLISDLGLSGIPPARPTGEQPKMAAAG